MDSLKCKHRATHRQEHEIYSAQKEWVVIADSFASVCENPELCETFNTSQIKIENVLVCLDCKHRE